MAATARVRVDVSRCRRLRQLGPTSWSARCVQLDDLALGRWDDGAYLMAQLLQTAWVWKLGYPPRCPDDLVFQDPSTAIE